MLAYVLFYKSFLSYFEFIVQGYSTGSIHIGLIMLYGSRNGLLQDGINSLLMCCFIINEILLDTPGTPFTNMA